MAETWFYVADPMFVLGGIVAFFVLLFILAASIVRRMLK